MSKFEKIIASWRSSKQNENLSTVKSVLDHYFPGFWYQLNTSGSHNYKLQHECLKKDKKFGDAGALNFPVKHKQVKYYYLKDIVKAIELLKEYESEKES